MRKIVVYLFMCLFIFACGEKVSKYVKAANAGDKEAQYN